MTTTVTRGAGRPAAAARKAKHDQRDPQPRSHTTEAINAHVQSAPDSETAMERALDGTAYGRMTVDELKARAKVLQVKPIPRAKGALLSAILEAERAEQAAQQESPEAIAVPEQAAPPVISNAGEPKGIGKAEKLAEALRPAGWDAEVLGEGPRVTIQLRRKSETLTVTWDTGVFNYEETAHAVGDRVTKVRNVSAAIKLGQRPAEAAEADLARVVKNRTFNKAKVEKAGAPARSRLPFDPAEVTESDLFKALAGKVVEWINRISRDTDSATVSTDPRKFRLDPPRPDGSQTIHFTTLEGFKALRLQDITRVLPAGSNPRKKRDTE